MNISLGQAQTLAYTCWRKILRHWDSNSPVRSQQARRHCQSFVAHLHDNSAGLGVVLGYFTEDNGIDLDLRAAALMATVEDAQALNLFEHMDFDFSKLPKTKQDFDEEISGLMEMDFMCERNAHITNTVKQDYFEQRVQQLCVEQQHAPKTLEFPYQDYAMALLNVVVPAARAQCQHMEHVSQSFLGVPVDTGLAQKITERRDERAVQHTGAHL